MHYVSFKPSPWYLVERITDAGSAAKDKFPLVRTRKLQFRGRAESSPTPHSELAGKLVINNERNTERSARSTKNDKLERNWLSPGIAQHECFIKFVFPLPGTQTGSTTAFRCRSPSWYLDRSVSLQRFQFACPIRWLLIHVQISNSARKKYIVVS